MHHYCFELGRTTESATASRRSQNSKNTIPAPRTPEVRRATAVGNAAIVEIAANIRCRGGEAHALPQRGHRSSRPVRQRILARKPPMREPHEGHVSIDGKRIRHFSCGNDPQSVSSTAPPANECTRQDPLVSARQMLIRPPPNLPVRNKRERPIYSSANHDGAVGASSKTPSLNMIAIESHA